ncbi:MAG: bifunctional adenosylcobinamide kinase/adenosylcobinamide-phosphate guanylyltransferase, partial [Planctomycetota bacterium]|nr:bifunctional adenosylcobinamide kinase/adenosylcobinamide-phosphate guanylyltransferase [Planctomycetota bacterium]
MLGLVYGGSGSGKSAWAEERLLDLSRSGSRVYLATMRPEGGEERILRHRRRRQDRGFATLECYGTLIGLAPPPGTSLLLECAGNLLANLMFDSPGQGEAAELAWQGITGLGERVDNLLVVSNDIFADGGEVTPAVRDYQVALAWLNRRLAQAAAEVVEVVAGYPVYFRRA